MSRIIKSVLIEYWNKQITTCKKPIISDIVPKWKKKQDKMKIY